MSSQPFINKKYCWSLDFLEHQTYWKVLNQPQINFIPHVKILSDKLVWGTGLYKVRKICSFWFSIFNYYIGNLSSPYSGGGYSSSEDSRSSATPSLHHSYETLNMSDSSISASHPHRPAPQPPENSKGELIFWEQCMEWYGKNKTYSSVMALTLTLHQLKDVTNFVLKLIQLRSFLLCQKNGFSLLTRHLQKKLKLYVLFAICTPFMISVCLSVCLSMIVICFWSL